MVKKQKGLTWAVILAVAAAAATAAAGGRPPGAVGASIWMAGVTALPTRRYWPPKSNRFIEDTASCADWALSYSREEGKSNIRLKRLERKVQLKSSGRALCHLLCNYQRALMANCPQLSLRKITTTTKKQKLTMKACEEPAPTPPLSPARHM